MRLFAALVAAAALSVATAQAEHTNFRPTDARATSAIAKIAQEFDSHPLIMMGELHRSREIHTFLQQMLRDPKFICRADDIVVEFGNARLQNIADAYASGGNVSDSQLQSILRSTAVPLTWNSSVYKKFLETVRDINKAHLCRHPLRLVLADVSFDWSVIKTVADYARVTDRDGSYASVVEREVLARHHHGFLLAGEAHVWKSVPEGGDFDEPNVAQILERKHPGSLFCLLPVTTPGAAQELRMGPAPSFRTVRVSDLGNAEYGMIAPGASEVSRKVKGKDVWKITPARNWPAMRDVADGLFYVDGNTSVYPSPTIYLDPEYQKELRRRATIIKAYSGQDFLVVLDGLIKDARNIESARGHH